jgi:hypothetical protein
MFAKFFNMDAIVAALAETLYFTKKGPNKFNKLKMSWTEWILWPFASIASYAGYTSSSSKYRKAMTYAK